MPRVDPDKFLNELNRLYDAAKEKQGTVFLTLKTSNLRQKKAEKHGGKDERHCLIRASDGKKKKISTLVPKKSLAQFRASFDVILRAKLDRLKKRDRQKDKGKKKGGDGGK